MEVRIAWIALATLAAFCCLATQLSPVTAASEELNNCLPPSIKKQGKPAGYFIVGAKVVIPCIASGDPALTFEWQKNGKPMNLASEKSQRRMTMEMGTGIGTLVIFEAKKEDAGLYQCVVMNNCGTSLSIVSILQHANIQVFPQGDQPEVVKDVLGSSVKLTCKAPASSPKAVVSWILTDSSGSTGNVLVDYEEDADDGDYNNVKLDNRVTMDYDGNLYITSLRKEDEEDGKTYVCQARNRLTRASVNGEDKVVVTKGTDINEMGVDLMWTSEDEPLVLQGKKAKFKCIFSGEPEPVIKWYHGNPWKELEKDDKRVAPDHHELVIKDVQKGDAGRYMCSGMNSLNRQAKNHTFTLVVKASPQWRVTPRDVMAGVKENANFDCDAVGNPAPSVQWFINGKPYSKDSSKGILSGNTLSFKNLEKEDSQVIQCNASNIYGYIWSDVYLYVQALPPTILTRPNPSLIVARDSNVTLTCEVTGKPTPKVVWYKGNQPLNHQRFVVLDSGNLVIQETTMRDKGTYTCNAKNNYGEIEASGKLTVRDKTQIVSKPVSEKVDYLNQATFTCGAKTDNFESKNLKIKWLKDGAPINTSDPRIVVTKAGLTIYDTRSSDTGSYTCVAKSSIDNDTATATLEVRAPPDPPYNVIMPECLGKGATLVWRFDEKMRNFEKMVEFIVESKNEYSPDTWTKLATVKYPTANVKVNLSPYAKYWFRVRGVNNMGAGEPSKPTTSYCQTLMARPDKNPENVRTDQQYTGFLVVKWTAMKEIELNGERFQYDIEIQDLNNAGTYIKENVTDYRKDEYRLSVGTVYSPYLITVRSRNRAGACKESPKKVMGYSGEAPPKVKVETFEVDPDINVTATMAGFRWSPVDTSPEMVQGKFQGYKIRFWKKGLKESSMHQEIIPFEGEGLLRRKRNVDDDGFVRGMVMNLPSFSEIVADVVVINTNFESQGSNQVDLVTPEGVPGPVKFLEAYNRGSYHIKVNWQSPVHPNGVLTAYELSYRKIIVDSLDFGELVVVSDDIPPQDERYTITGLEENTKYRIYIKARTSIDWGKDYFIDIVTASMLMDLVPPKIDNVEALDNEANVSWTLDLSNEGDRVGFTYYLQHKKKGDDKWTTSDEPVTDRSWAHLDHLQPGTTYQVRVIAKDMKNHKQEPSEAHSFHTSGVGAARASFLSAGWFIGMMIAIAVLIFILFIVCILKRNRGDNYPVQEKERLRGNCDDNHDNFNEFGKGSDENGIGVSSSFDRDGEKVPLDVDADSMDDDSASRFNEDGSFIGQYGRGDKANDATHVSASSIV